MTKAGRKATVVLMGVLAMLAGGRASAQDEPVATSDQREATIVLHVVNHAALPGDVLNHVKEHVARVYEVIGVRIVWVDSEQAVGKHRDGGLHLTVMLLPRDMARKKMSAERLTNVTRPGSSLPSGAPTSSATASPRCPVTQVLSRSSSATSSLTKWAISCCRRRGHSRTGIMRATVRRARHSPSRVSTRRRPTASGID